MAARFIALWTLSLAALSSVGPSRAAEALPRPTEAESQALLAILARLRSPENAEYMPVPVEDVVRSLSQVVTKSFVGRDGESSVRVTVRIRTHHVRWQEDYGGEQGFGENRPVGRYVWRIRMASRRTSSGREMTLTANNLIMLSGPHILAAERDTLGRIANESLLYHELLHGQLQVNAMDNPSWRARVISSWDVDTSGTDPNHRWVYDLQARYLLGRGSRYAYTVPAASAAAPKTFVLSIGRTPTGYVGAVTGDIRSLPHGNVENLRIHVENRGADRGKVTLHGELRDPGRGGFFLAVIDPVIRSASAGEAQRAG